MYELGIVVYGDDAKDLAEIFGIIEASDLPPWVASVQLSGDSSEFDSLFYGLQSRSERPDRWRDYIIREGDTQAQSIGRAIHQLQLAMGEYNKHLVVLSSSVRLAPDWYKQMRAALEQATVRNEAGDFNVPGRIAFVGPVSDGIALPAQHLDLAEEDVSLGIVGYAAHRAKYLYGVAGHADSLDPLMVFCAATDAMTLAYALTSDQVSDARRWRDAFDYDGQCAVAEGCYVATTKPKRVGAWEAGDGLARLAGYREYVANYPNQSVVATITVTLDTVRSLDMLKATIASCASVVDGIAVCFDGDPTVVLDDARASRSPLQPGDEKVLKSCEGLMASAMSLTLTNWLKSIVAAVAGRPVAANAVVYGGSDLNEGRRRAYKAARVIGATWLLLLEPDELLDGSVSRQYLTRLASHPDPTVLGYDCGIVTLYNSTTQVRADGSRGTSMEKGPSGVRLVRWVSEVRTTPAVSANGRGVAIAPLFSEESIRAANIRIRKLDMLRPQDRLHMQESSESVSVYAYHDQTRMGFHCLAYPRESLDDVARWLDIAVGACDDSVVVWTDDNQPPSGWTELVHYMGGRIVWHPLNENLAAARNAGINALSENKKLTWAWFVDPDEWFGNPLKDAAALRRMCESVRYGYLVQTCNYRRDGTPNISDSVRISRLVEGIRMDGRVHEGFSDAWKRLQAQGIHPRLVYAPFVVQHRGMSFTQERMREKLDKYERLLRLEIADRPENPGAWTSLAWHFFNDGAMEEGEECLRRAVACAGTSYLPYREMAYWHLRQAQTMLDASIDRLSEGHQWYKPAVELKKALSRHVEPMQVIARDESRPVAPLPKFRDV